MKGRKMGVDHNTFTRANLSMVVPVTHPPESAVLGLVFLCLSPTSLRCVFAPSSAAGLGFVYVRTSPTDTFWAERMPGNALACSHLPPGLLLRLSNTVTIHPVFRFYTYPKHPQDPSYLPHQPHRPLRIYPNQ